MQTLRYDLVEAPLGFFGLEFLQDFFFPVQPAEIVKTRFHLSYNTQTITGSFQAQNIGLMLQPPIASPIPGDEGVLTEVFTGGDFGWSGTGAFTFDGETDLLNGVVLPAPPGAGVMLYAITYLNARRFEDPPAFEPMGGQFSGSYVEVDFVFIPEPGAASLAATAVAALLRRRTRRSARP